MKKFFLINLILSICFSIYAQQTEINLEAKVPIDSKVVYGTLPNGLTYYIRHNEKPKDRAEYYIVFDVGAILETDKQNGLAHFTEHMAFNGTKNFPDKGVLDFMENNGVAFGHNVNAFTSTDVTAYMLSKVPTTREGLIDTSLLVLHDWSNFISFENSEIDAERGVIHEEWRTRRNADFRLRNKTANAMYNGSKYVEHDVIGLIDVIDNCEYQTLKDFYKDWYRPNLQAIIVVGDVDVKQIEEKIKTLFSDIENPKNQKERYLVEIPNNKEPLIAVATDPEASKVIVQILYKHDIVKKENKNSDYYINQFNTNLFTLMYNNRLKELVQKENPPFIFAYNFYGDFIRTKAAFYSIAYANPTDINASIRTLLIENKRLKQFGFVQSELERAKKELMQTIENKYKEREKSESGVYIWKYFSHFLANEPIPGIEFEYEFAQDILPKITLEEVNTLAANRITKENMVITVTGPEIEAMELINDETINKIIKEIDETETTAYQEETIDADFIKEEPKAYMPISEKTEDGIYEWKFANGATVIIKPTNFKDDEILVSAYSFGGYSLVPDNEIASAQMATSIISLSGAGDFSNIDIDKKLAGKNVKITPIINQTTEGFKGSCAPNDFETLLQLMYLYHTQPRNSKQAFSSYLQRMNSWVENKQLDPDSRFRDTISITKSNKHIRNQSFNKEFLSKVEFDKVHEIYNDRFSGIDEFTYIFVGNIDVETAKPLIATYIGGIKDNKRKETFKDNKIFPPTGVVKKTLKTELEVEKATIYVGFHGKYKYSAQNNMFINTLVHILRLRYTETIREEEGGSYGVSVWTRKNRFPYENYFINIKFDCNPDKYEELKNIVYQEIEKIKKDGPTKEDLHKTKEYFLKTREELLMENSFWQTAIKMKYLYGYDPSAKENYNDLIEKLTTKSLKKAANEYFDNENYIEIIMIPK